MRRLRLPVFWGTCICLGLAWYVGRFSTPTQIVTKAPLEVESGAHGAYYLASGGKKVFLDDARLLSTDTPEGHAFETKEIDGELTTTYYKLSAESHWGVWSMFPALVAIALCWSTREPVVSLAMGVVAGALLLGKYDLLSEVLVPTLQTEQMATLIALIWLIGGLLGTWTRTGAAEAFAESVSGRFVRGPRSAKFVAWLLGVIFFQGGLLSIFIIGTAVKPVADANRVSHEELAYIVDSTAAPIASQLALNAWPLYIQALIFVPGVSWLATESERITFFFKSVPFCFYASFAVLGTLLLSLDKAPLLNKKLRKAITRARETGELDAPGAEQLSAMEVQTSRVPAGYAPHVIDFFLPLATLLFIVFATFINDGSPNILLAFGGTLLVAVGLASLRGMRMSYLVEGALDGIKGYTPALVILVLAIMIGSTCKETGTGTFLVALLGSHIPYWLLPAGLLILTVLIAFSTGTSFGTYAVVFPVAMPLAWAVATAHELSHPQLFMIVCFATVMDGSVFGDQCSPISDTTVLASMCSGCDLMDHVQTQLPQAALAAGLAATGWTGVAWFCA